MKLPLGSRIGLRTKFLLSAAALVLLTLVPVLVSTVSRVEESILERERVHGTELARLLAGRCGEAVRREDATAVAAIVEPILGDDTVLYAIVSDADDRILCASSVRGPLDVAEFDRHVHPERSGMHRIDVPGLGEILEFSSWIRGADRDLSSDAILGRVRIGLDSSAVSREISGMRTQILRLGLLALGAAFGVAIVLAQVVVGRPVRMLRLATRRVASGDLDAEVPLGSKDEVGGLAGDFNRMVEQLRESRERLAKKADEIHRANTELSEAKQLLDSVVSASTNHAILAADPAGRILSANAAVEGVFGHAPGAVLGRSVDELLADPDAGIERVRAQYARAIEGREDSECEIVARHADGSTFVASLSIAVRHDPQGAPIGFVLIVRDLARERDERELVLRNQELERTSRLKSEFLANMSHELRTPLNSVIGFSEVLLDGYFGELNDSQREYIQDIHHSGRHLLELINDILDLSKIEAGRMELEIEPFDVRDSIDRVRSMIAGQATKKDIDLETDIAADVSTIAADAGRFKQILLNLLSNAVKFTPEAGRVTLRVDHDGRFLRVTVEDTGIGIPAAYLSRVFEKFQQVEDGYRRSHGGTGLGLAIVKDFVELHGGTVRVESVVDHGSRFTVRLPLEGPTGFVGTDSPSARRPVAQGERGGDSDLSVSSASTEPSAGSPPTDGESAASFTERLELEEASARGAAVSASEGGAAAKPRVLVVDDEAFRLQTLFRHLSADFRVETAMGGDQALERIAIEPPDALVLELFLPDKDGFDVLRDLRARVGMRLPVVVVASAPEEGRGFAVGARDYLVKPVRRTELLARLEGLHLAEPGRSAPPRVLVVDDNARERRLLESYLRPAGYEIRTAASAVEAVATIREFEPDLVLLDLAMPDRSGFGVVHDLRASGLPLPSLVLMSGVLSFDEKIGLMEEVYSHATAGPLDRSSLAAEVLRVIEHGARGATATERRPR